VAYFGRKRNAFLTDFYPITAGLGLAGYAGDVAAVYHPIIGLMVLGAILILTAIILTFTPNYDKVMTVSKKSRRRFFVK